MPQVTSLNCDGLVINWNSTNREPVIAKVPNVVIHTPIKIAKLFSEKVVASE